MKYWFASLFILILFSASSCKKNDPGVLPGVEGLDSLERNGYKFNYVSVQLDGQTYVCRDGGGSYGLGNRQVNRKMGYIGPYGVDLDKGDPDSILFSREYSLSDSTLDMQIHFSKKLAKKDCRQELWFYYPHNQLDLFRQGPQGFATDFDRENSFDGVAIELTLKEGDKRVRYSTYSLQFPTLPTSITNDSQKGSFFNITKVGTMQSGDYIEATFKAKIFDLKEQSKTIDIGFIRLHIGSFTRQ